MPIQYEHLIQLINEKHDERKHELDEFRKEFSIHITQDSAAFAKAISAMEHITKTLDERGALFKTMNDRITTLETKIAVAMGAGVVVVFLVEMAVRLIR